MQKGMGVGPSSSSSSSFAAAGRYLWCENCSAIQHEDACFHSNWVKRPLKDVVFAKNVVCAVCGEGPSAVPGWYIHYEPCGHVVHLDICYNPTTMHSRCPANDGGTLKDAGNLSCNVRGVKKNADVTVYKLQQCALPVSVAAEYLSGGGHLHLAWHLATDVQHPFQIFKNDVLFPTCYNGKDMSPGLRKYLVDCFKLPCELPYGTDAKGNSPFEQLCKDHTAALYSGRRAPGVRRVYLCFGARVAATVMKSLEHPARTAVVCFTGWHDFHRHLEIRPFRVLTLTPSPITTTGIISTRNSP